RRRLRPVPDQRNLLRVRAVRVAGLEAELAERVHQVLHGPLLAHRARRAALELIRRQRADPGQELIGVDGLGRGAHLLPSQRRAALGPGLGGAAASGEQERRCEPAGRSGHGPHLSMEWDGCGWLSAVVNTRARPMFRAAPPYGPADVRASGADPRQWRTA